MYKRKRVEDNEMYCKYSNNSKCNHKNPFMNSVEGHNALREHQKACGKKCDPLQIEEAKKTSLEVTKKSRSEGISTFQKLWQRAVSLAIFLFFIQIKKKS